MGGQPHILWAERQEGVISAAQLHACGFMPRQIDRALGHWLHPLHRGIYSVGTRRPTPRGRCWAAVLACGDGAVLSHRSAAGWWGLTQGFPSRPEVTIEQARRAQKGIRLFRRPLPRGEVTKRHGLRMTSVARTILDLAAVAPRWQVENAINEAEFLQVWDTLLLPSLIERHPRRKGIPMLKAILEDGVIRMTKSDLERRFLAFLRKRRLPLPQTNIEMVLAGKPIQPDCAWPYARLIIELDSRAAHETKKRFDSDKRRDRKLDIAGWTVWRVTAYLLKHDADELEADIRGRLAEATSPG